MINAYMDIQGSLYVNDAHELVEFFDSPEGLASLQNPLALNVLHFSSGAQDMVFCDTFGHLTLVQF
jgi:hypothetical protein